MNTEDKENPHHTRKVSSVRMIGRLLVFVLPYWPWLSVAILMHLVVTALTFVSPFLIGWVVDDIGDRRYDQLSWYALLAVMAALLGGLLSLLRTWTHTRATGHAMWDMRAYVFDSLQRLNIGYHERESSGQIISRAIEDIRQVEGFYRMVAFMMVEIAVVFTAALAVMFTMNWRLALWSVSTLPPAALLTAYFAGRVREGHFAVREQVGQMTTVLQENISGVRVIRGFAQEDPQIQKFRDRSHGIIGKVMVAVKLWTFHGSIVRFLVVIAGAMTFAAGASMVGQRNAALAPYMLDIESSRRTVGTVGMVAAHGTALAPYSSMPTVGTTGMTAAHNTVLAPYLVNVPTLGIIGVTAASRTALVANVPDIERIGLTIGTVVIFFMLQRQISFRLHGLGRMVSHLQRAVASGDRVFEVLDLVPEVTERRNSVKLPPGPGLVQFENVHFGYEPEKEVLSDIDLTVQPGKMVAVVGATGSGKSTLVSLLPRFYDVTSGRILIDGMDIRDLRLKSLRKNIGLVFQESFLFSARVVDNIAYGDPDAEFDAVTEAARQARADEFVGELPEGYDTVIGERGVTLSGGQRQRLTIARALLRNPRILILDDSTSSVDPTTEREIHETMMNAAANRTTFVIAHRLSTVRRADLIIVLDHGCIAETGTHDNLLVQGGLYRQIYDMQFRDDELRLADDGVIERPGFLSHPSDGGDNT